MGLSPPQVGPVGCPGGASPLPCCGCRRAAGFTAGLPGSRAAAPSRRGRAPSRAPAPTQGGCGAAASQGGGQGCIHPITPSPGGTQQALGAPDWGCKGREGPLRGVATGLGPQGRQPAAATAPHPAFRPGGIPVPVHPPPPRDGPCSPWRWGARGVGRRWPLPVVCGCCRSAGCRGVGDEPPAACVSRPAPAAECTTKTTIAPRPPPPPHPTGDGDVSSVRETGMLNSLRAGRQTSAACRGVGSGYRWGAAPRFWGTR